MDEFVLGREIIHHALYLFGLTIIFGLKDVLALLYFVVVVFVPFSIVEQDHNNCINQEHSEDKETNHHS